MTALILEHVAGPPGEPASLWAYVDGFRERHAADPASPPIAPELVRWRLLQRIIIALMYIHGKGIVHLDLKGDNVLLGPSRCGIAPEIKVTDFGLSQIIGRSVAECEGCSMFVAPEMVWREDGVSLQASPAMDAWSLGQIALMMVRPSSKTETGGGSEDEAASMGPEDDEAAVQRSLQEIEGICEPQWREFVEECCKVDPGDRANLDELLKIVKAHLKALEQPSVIDVPAHACSAALPTMVRAQHTVPVRKAAVYWRTRGNEWRGRCFGCCPVQNVCPVDRVVWKGASSGALCSCRLQSGAG